MRDAFAVLFFVSVGMLFDPGVARITGFRWSLVVVLLAKPLVAFDRLDALSAAAPLTVAIALAQIGEFSFILATIGRELGLLTPVATNALVAASIVSSCSTARVSTRLAVRRWCSARPACGRC